MQPTITAGNGSYILITPFSSGFVNDLKSSVPAWGRTYNKERRAWQIQAKFGQTAVDLYRKHFGVVCRLPMLADANESEQGILKVIYIGQIKDRGNGERTASGWMLDEDTPTLFPKGSWRVIFPEKALRRYFDPEYGAEQKTVPSGNYYQILGIGTGASADEIKSGYRRMVRQWHPDVCKEPNATDVFLSIQKAYEILNNPKKKGRYDAGLRLSVSTEPVEKKEPEPSDGWRSPLRCGLLLCEYDRFGDRYTVNKILSWADITDNEGHVLTTSWIMGEDTPVMAWN